MRITTTGNVGIGTNSPINITGYRGLTINGTSGGFTYWNIDNVDTGRIITDSSNFYIDNLTTGATIFRTTSDSSERMRITSTGVVQPGANGTQDLGTSSLRWCTIYTSDLSLSNGIGDYTIVEGEEKLYLYNNKNNKVYSFVLQEEDPLTATPKKS